MFLHDRLSATRGCSIEGGKWLLLGQSSHCVGLLDCGRELQGEGGSCFCGTFCYAGLLN